MNLPVYFRNGLPVAELPPDASLGAGQLETMRLQGGRVPLWRLHRARLLRSGAVTPGDLEPVESTLGQFGHFPGPARVRLRFSEPGPRRSWDMAVESLDPGEGLESGVCLSLCHTRLEPSEIANPGCKLLQRPRYNRALAELPATGITCDGLLLDTAGRAIETLRCNLLVRTGAGWLTPDLSRCGVRGVMRDWLRERVPVREVDISVEMLEHAAELALCNSVRGVLPVAELDGRSLGTPGPETRKLQQLVTEELW
ncbi:aminodeoxychorismate lyase apoprotein [Microbulbifer yueqingensis]|uniref:Aminodeoxychorismate lyase apoprotein n=1 Tax=Microbulbifer yueqingensis TaxID=658219 RepID=A0A1G8ZL54_9GAMM|nr:aminodeoxychorismate lyase apoprotein [Microbulbifer yueqingensis]